jgi:hypothetical protein
MKGREERRKREGIAGSQNVEALNGKNVKALKG